MFRNARKLGMKEEKKKAGYERKNLAMLSYPFIIKADCFWLKIIVLL